MESGAMIEAGAVFAALLAALRVIEKLVDKKMASSSTASPSPEVAMQLASIAETTAATGQTLERINDKLDDMDMRHAAMATLSGAIDSRTKDIQNVAHKVHILCEAQNKDLERRKLLEELKASQSGTSPAVA